MRSPPVCGTNEDVLFVRDGEARAFARRGEGDGRYTSSMASTFALVSGRVPSAPLDLPRRMEAVYQHLQAAGWRVVVKTIGTDFSGPLGIPTPKAQPIELYLHREGTFTPVDAQDALSS